MSDRNDRFFVTEIIRETIFELYRVSLASFLITSLFEPQSGQCPSQAEIPYSPEVAIESYIEPALSQAVTGADEAASAAQRTGLIQIEAKIVVSRQTHVAIVAGKQGTMLHRLRELSKRKIEEVSLIQPSILQSIVTPACLDLFLTIIMI